MRLGIVGHHFAFLSGRDVVNQFIAQSEEFAGFRHFIRIVLRPVGIVTLAVGMDAIHEIVIVIPAPVFLFHGGQNLGGISFGLMRLMAVDAREEDLAKLVVSRFGGGETIDRKWLLRFCIKLLRWREEVNKSERILLGHTLHRCRVES